jgi:hypothetical protein
MSENATPDTPGNPSGTEIQIRLHEVARLVRASRTIDPQARQTLAELLDELGTVLGPAAFGAAGSAEVDHLAQTTAHLAESLHHPHDRGRLGQARDALEQAVLSAEAQAPFAAGVVRRLLDALGNIGI